MSVVVALAVGALIGFVAGSPDRVIARRLADRFAEIMQDYTNRLRARGYHITSEDEEACADLAFWRSRVQP